MNVPAGRWSGKKILVLSGGEDTLVNYVDGGSHAFVRRLQGEGVEVSAWVQDGVCVFVLRGERRELMSGAEDIVARGRCSTRPQRSCGRMRSGSKLSRVGSCERASGAAAELRRGEGAACEAGFERLLGF